MAFTSRWTPPRRLAVPLALAAAALGTSPMTRASTPSADPPPTLAPCPSTPNCVSSLAGDERHRVAPLEAGGSPEEVLARLREIIEAMPRTRIVAAGSGYLRAEFRSRLFGFVDDLELLADRAAGVVQVRSASRVGASDLGANRRRVEALRRRLAAASTER